MCVCVCQGMNRRTRARRASHLPLCGLVHVPHIQLRARHVRDAVEAGVHVHVLRGHAQHARQHHLR